MTAEKPTDTPADNEETRQLEVPGEDSAPVFVDSTGRRGRRIRFAFYGIGGLSLTYAGMVAMSLAGGPLNPENLLPFPDLLINRPAAVDSTPEPGNGAPNDPARQGDGTRRASGQAGQAGPGQSPGQAAQPGVAPAGTPPPGGVPEATATASQPPATQPPASQPPSAPASGNPAPTGSQNPGSGGGGSVVPESNTGGAGTNTNTGSTTSGSGTTTGGSGAGTGTTTGGTGTGSGSGTGSGTGSGSGTGTGSSGTGNTSTEPPAAPPATNAAVPANKWAESTRRRARRVSAPAQGATPTQSATSVPPAGSTVGGAA